MTAGVCRCGHVRQVHEHYRFGTDCGVCGRSGCPAFAVDNDRSVSRDDAVRADTRRADPAGDPGLRDRAVGTG